MTTAVLLVLFGALSRLLPHPPNAVAMGDAENRVTGSALPRRPRHRAYLGATLSAVEKLTVSLRATFVGRRADVDALSFLPIEAPSFVRYDLFARYELAYLAPYARVENVMDRKYEEANGFPAPGRRFAVGLEAKF
jgi:vitamin B12 transporter